MVITARSAVGVAMIWLATVAGVSATAWFAIDRAGRDLTGGGASSLSSLTAATAGGATPHSGPLATDGRPQPSASQSGPAGSATVGPAPPVDRSVRVVGGQVSARCTGATILLRTAQPDNGWQVDVDSSGPEEVALSFQVGDKDSERGTQVKAVCTDGTPAFTVQNKS